MYTTLFVDTLSKSPKHQYITHFRKSSTAAEYFLHHFYHFSSSNYIIKGLSKRIHRRRRDKSGALVWKYLKCLFCATKHETSGECLDEGWRLGNIHKPASYLRGFICYTQSLPLLCTYRRSLPQSERLLIVNSNFQCTKKRDGHPCAFTAYGFFLF